MPLQKSLTKKMKTKRKKVKAFHQKMKVFRVTDPKMAVLMWGISHSVSQLSHVPPPVMLLKDDFKAYSKIKIDNHFYNKENMPGHFKFKEYMPLVFRNLRERYNIEERSFAGSFLIQPNVSCSSGNSGAKFLQTRDKRYYVKTMEKEEVEMMHNIMPSYHQYIVECHSDTLLPQYLGMYRTTLDGKEYYYLVIRSVFSNKNRIHRKYDLKGSRIDREAKDSEKEKDFPTFKDNDFTKDNVKLCMQPDRKKSLLDKLKKDVNFLSSLNIMDYSLLVGIHDTEHIDSDPEDENDGGEDDFETGEESADGIDEPYSPDDTDCPELVNGSGGGTTKRYSRSESTGSTGADIIYDPEYYAVPCSDESRHEIYYLGIIDVLTYYGATKKAAHAAKTVKHGVLNMRRQNVRRRSISEPGNKRWSWRFDDSLSFDFAKEKGTSQDIDVKNQAGAEISTVKPQVYASRFLEFIEHALTGDSGPPVDVATTPAVEAETPNEKITTEQS